MNKDLSTLLMEVQELHNDHAALNAFSPFPGDIEPNQIEPFDVPARRLMLGETGFSSAKYKGLCQSLFDVAPLMLWRETYKGSNISSDFMDRFGCYEIIGRDTPFASKKIRSFLVYQPPHLHYPWHHHPAEEMYVVLNGQAEFGLEGEESRTLVAGDSSYHAPNRPHALTTHDYPVLAYVIWRNEFDTAPIWTYPDAFEK